MALAALAIGVGIASSIVGGQVRSRAERLRAEALEENALVRLSATTSGLAAREREELANAQQARRLGRRQTAILESRAIAAGASAGTGAVDATQDVQAGLAEFLGSIDENIARVQAQLARTRRGAQKEFEAARKAARAGISGPGVDFLDFLNIGLQGIQAFEALPRARNTFDDTGGEDDE